MLISTLSTQISVVEIPDGLALANAIVDTVRDPLLVLDQELRVIAASRSFYTRFGLTRDAIRGEVFVRSMAVSGIFRNFVNCWRQL